MVTETITREVSTHEEETVEAIEESMDANLGSGKLTIPVDKFLEMARMGGAVSTDKARPILMAVELRIEEVSDGDDRDGRVQVRVTGTDSYILGTRTWVVDDSDKGLIGRGALIPAKELLAFSKLVGKYGFVTIELEDHLNYSGEPDGGTQVKITHLGGASQTFYQDGRYPKWETFFQGIDDGSTGEVSGVAINPNYLIRLHKTVDPRCQYPVKLNFYSDNNLKPIEVKVGGAGTFRGLIMPVRV